MKRVFFTQNTDPEVTIIQEVHTEDYYRGDNIKGPYHQLGDLTRDMVSH